ncbi:DUF4333 domain-containing protein [Streptomyces sviceus]|uniref:DUF4333 domain-containing protein n=1 Tax=Streptomyces sviceus TaxID=285530 RepID=UPI0036EABE63
MQRSECLLGVVGGATAVVAVGGVDTYLLSGTQSTSGLDEHTMVTVDGHKALSARIVAGRTQDNPLPWVGKKVTDVSCPTGLKAVVGATITCTGRSDAKDVPIPVSVVNADATSVTWKFER